MLIFINPNSLKMSSPAKKRTMGHDGSPWYYFEFITYY